MNKNAIVIILLLAIAGGIGFIAWTNYQERQKTEQEEIAWQRRMEEREEEQREKERRAAELTQRRCNIFYEAFEGSSRFYGEVSECEVGYIEDIDSKWEKVYFWTHWKGTSLFGESEKTVKYSLEIQKDLSHYRDLRSAD